MPNVHAQSRRLARRLRARVSCGMDARRVTHTLLIIGGIYCCAPSLVAQRSDPTPVDPPEKSWVATTDSNSDDLLPTRVPVRIVESHKQNGERTLDKRSVEIRGTDGRFEPYQDIERETLQVDATTVRTVTRTFSQDVNGKKALVQVTEEEKHILPGGDSNIVRVTYNPDVNGKLQPVQREIVESTKIAENLEETNRTVMLSSINGSLAPAFKTHETRKRAAKDTVETETTAWLPDLNGQWQLREIRQSVATREENDRKIEETVSRPDAEGKLIQISRVVSHESESASGEKRNSVESYSIDVPGTTRDGSLHLIERQTNIGRSSSTAERSTEQRVEQINPGDPGASLRVSVLIDDKMVSAPSGEQSTVTIRARDSNGSFAVVSVDMTKSDRIPAIQIQPTLSEPSK
jgi:hypothetical protein